MNGPGGISQKDQEIADELLAEMRRKGKLLSEHPPITEPVSAFQVQVGGNHYKDFQIQPTEFIHINGLGFLQGCIIKRICRYKQKDGLKDLQKIKHEVDMLIELEGYR